MTGQARIAAKIMCGDITTQAILQHTHAHMCGEALGANYLGVPLGELKFAQVSIMRALDLIFQANYLASVE